MKNLGIGSITALFVLASAACALEMPQGETAVSSSASALEESIRNGKPFVHANGHVATWSTQGDISTSNAFMVPQGNNGRSCATCHLPEAGWSIRPDQIQAMFDSTGGKHPIFNPADADNPNDPRAVSENIEDRRAAYSMLLKGNFRRGSVAATREFTIVAADDPYGFARPDPTEVGGPAARISTFRRSMPTANFHTHRLDAPGAIGWDHGSATLFAQAENNVRTGQNTPAITSPPADTNIVNEIVAFEASFATANQILPGVGDLTECGGKGGAKNLSDQPRVAGAFDLYSAWLSRACATPARRSIARGEVLFNTRTRANGGGTCLGCHNAQNSGANINGMLFDIGASNEAFRTPDMPLYTLECKAGLPVNPTTGLPPCEPGTQIRTTDPGRANRTGRWADINRFKTPSLRGVSSHGPYLHNGIAHTLLDVVRFYETSLGFEFSPSEEQDLVNFMKAL